MHIKVFLLFFIITALFYNKLLSRDKYFQQEVNHSIIVSLDDEDHMLNAFIETEYINNSPDTLNFIYMHLWPNAYSSNKTAFAKQRLNFGWTDFQFTSDRNRGYIDSIDFKVNGAAASWKLLDNFSDIAIVSTNNLVYPGDTIFISTPFRVKFPDASFSRLGRYEQAYYVTQWYPKPAVYDKYGWHPMPYLSIGEFYSEFGTIEVEITLPENYIVAASGDLVTKSEKEILDSLANYWGQLINNRMLPDNLRFPASSSKMKTISYRLENAHDFAWVADKRFYVIVDSVRLNQSNRFITNYAFFNQEAQLWRYATSYMNRSISFMSEIVGEYPYKTFSAVQAVNSGGANMEYPGLTTIGQKHNSFNLDRVITHEAIHNWFYGALGFNERRNPWLDEGFTTYYDTRYIEKFYPNQKLVRDFSNTFIGEYFDIAHYDYSKSNYLTALILARLNIDMPANLHSEEYELANYFAILYNKTALSIKHLEMYLGTEVFDEIIQGFYKKWEFKHPYPEDVRMFFEKESGKDLSWFFDGLIGSTKKLDYKAKSINTKEDKYVLTIKNVGEIKAPFPVVAYYNDEIIDEIWLEGFKGTQTVSFSKDKNYTHFIIDPKYYTFDFNRKNNKIYNRVLFPRFKPFELQPIGSIENPLKNQVFVTPVVGWNTTNGLTPGFAFYNQIVPFNSNELFFMPMYGLDNNRFAGKTWAYKTFFSKNRDVFHSARIGLEYKSFGAYSFSQNNSYYNRLQPSLELVITPGISPGTVKNKFELRAVYLDLPDLTGAELNNAGALNRNNEWFYELSYHRFQNYSINKYEINTAIQMGEGMAKGWLEISCFLAYDSQENGIELRLFTGSFFTNQNDNSLIDTRFRLGSHAGYHDYLFDNIYFDRSYNKNTITSKQIYRNDGAFRIITPVGQTYEAIAAMNLTIDVPLIPVKLFADVGTYTSASDAFPGSERFPYVMGVVFEPFKDIFAIHVPLTMSEDIRTAADLVYDSYWETITFTLKFDNINPFRELKRITRFIY